MPLCKLDINSISYKAYYTITPRIPEHVPTGMGTEVAIVEIICTFWSRESWFIMWQLWQLFMTDSVTNSDTTQDIQRTSPGNKSSWGKGFVDRYIILGSRTVYF